MSPETDPRNRLDPDDDDPAPARAARAPAARVGDVVLVHCSMAPGPQPAEHEARVARAHAGGLLDLVVPKTERHRELSFERVPHGARPLLHGPWWELVPAQAAPPARVPQKK